MKRKKTYTGINIQYPITRLILEGKKTIETRTYPIPKEYVGKEMALIETPGEEGQFKARIVGLIVFGESFPYRNKNSFYKDSERHCVSRNSPWRWIETKPKWGWPILQIKAFDRNIPAPERKGIRYTKRIEI